MHCNFQNLYTEYGIKLALKELHYMSFPSRIYFSTAYLICAFYTFLVEWKVLISSFMVEYLNNFKR
jgi:hypothetical protein